MSDLIDRQALKQALGINADDCDKCAWGSYGRCKRGSDFEDACCAIDDAPSAEPNTGKWVNDINDIPMCNQCGYMTPYDRAIDDYEYGNYCPNCGAKMEV